MIILTPFTSSDFDRLILWIHNEEELMQFAGPDFTFPLTHTQLENYLDNRSRFPYKVVDDLTNEVIGHAEIFVADPGIAILCRILLGEESNRGKGLGLQIVQQLLEIAFTQLDAEKVELNVFDWNIPAIKCYKKAGFTINPDKVRKREVHGKIWTALNMTLRK